MKKIIKLIMLLTCMGLIFYFSAQPDTNSTVQTNVVVDFLYKIYAFVFGGNRIDYLLFVDKYFAPTRKLAHFSEFALLGILIYINIIEYIDTNKVLYSIIFASLYSISDEIHQLFVPGRYCSIIDMSIDISGAVFGILFIHLLLKRWKRN